MSDVTVSAAPAVVTLGADASAPKPAAPASNAENNEKPAWLDARLDQARKQAIKDLGQEGPRQGGVELCCSSRYWVSVMLRYLYELVNDIH